MSSARHQYMLYQETTPSITVPCPQHAPNICCSKKPHHQSYFLVLSTLPIYVVAGNHTINHTSLSSVRSQYMLQQETTPSITLPYPQYAPNICCTRKPHHKSHFLILSTLPIYAVPGNHTINHTSLSSARSHYMLYQETTPSIALPCPQHAPNICCTRKPHHQSHFTVLRTLPIYTVPGNHTINHTSLSSARSQYMLYQESTPSITLLCPQHAHNICCSRKPHHQSQFPVLSTLPIYAVAGSHTINHTTLSSARSQYML